MAKKKPAKKPKVIPSDAIDVHEILRRYYDTESKSYKILLVHSQLVARKALEIAKRRPQWKLDEKLLYEGAMLHDIGAFKCDSPSIGCFGTEPYIKHGVLGADILREEGLPLHALICERHTGVGLTLEMIQRRDLPLPHREMIPVSLEEQIICFSDCFYSKSGDPTEEKSIERIRQGMAKHGPDQILKFDVWCRLFLDD